MNPETKKKLYKEAQDTGTKVYYCEEVTKIHQHGGKAQRIVILYENYLKILGTNLKILHTYPLYNISSIQYENDSVILHFEQNVIQFIPPDLDSFLYIITYQVMRLLPDSQLRNIKIPSINPKPLRITYMYKSRFEYFLENATKPVIDARKVLSELIPNIIKEPNTIDFSCLRKDESVYEAFMHTLQIPGCIQNVVFPETTRFDIFKLCAEQLDFTHISHLEFQNNKITPFFAQFIQKILKSRSSLTSLSFCNTEFSLDSTKILTSAIGNEKIKSLTFENSLREPELNYLLQTDKFRSLRYLALPKTPDVKIRSLLPYIYNIYSLSLENCQLKIGDIFQELNSVELRNLRSLNLSGNEGCHFDGRLIKFPVNLIELSVENVHWGRNDLRAFLEVAFNHYPLEEYEDIEKGIPQTFQLSMSGTSSTSWDSPNEFFKKSTAQYLGALSWDDNPISEEFLGFIKRCSNLQFVSLNRCINPSNFVNFVQFVTNNSTIQHIDAKGDEEHNVKDMSRLALFLPTASSLRFMDISGHELSDESIQKLSESLIRCPSFEGISIDSTGVESLKPYEAMLQEFKMLGRPVRVSLPFNDLLRLWNDPLKDSIRLMISKLTGIPPNPKFPNEKPYGQFFYEAKKLFPMYLSANAFKHLEFHEPGTAAKPSRKEYIEELSVPSSEAVQSSEEEESSEPPSLKEETAPEIPNVATERESVQWVQEIEEEESYNEEPPHKSEEEDDSVPSVQSDVRGLSPISRGNVQPETDNGLSSDLQGLSVVSSGFSTMPSEPTRPFSKTPRMRARGGSFSRRAKEHADWSFPLRFVPDIDASETLDGVDANYSILRILHKFRNSK